VELEIRPANPQIRPEKSETQPKLSQVRPEKPEIQPEVSQAQPQKPEIHAEHSQIKPEKPETQPKLSQVQSEKPETQPEPSQVQPEKPETHPESSQVQPEKPATHPEPTQVQPEKPETQPEPSQVQPEKLETQLDIPETQIAKPVPLTQEPSLLNPYVRFFGVQDAPEAMRSVANYLLMATGRKGLFEEEISILRTFNASHYPAVVLKEIDEDVQRFKRMGRDLKMLTFMYVEGAMGNRQPTRPLAQRGPSAKGGRIVPALEEFPDETESLNT
jgi:hypothetical protein